jgi:hypothetical protein
MKIALKRIARNMEQKESCIIGLLKAKHDILFLKRGTPKILTGNDFWIWILIPFNPKRVQKEKSRFQGELKNFITRVQIDGKRDIKTPKKVLDLYVDDLIFEILKDFHNISRGDYTIGQWEDILTSHEYRNAKIQVASELIAKNIYENLT